MIDGTARAIRRKRAPGENPLAENFASLLALSGIVTTPRTSFRTLAPRDFQTSSGFSFSLSFLPKYLGKLYTFCDVSTPG